MSHYVTDLINIEFPSLSFEQNVMGNKKINVGLQGMCSYYFF